MIKIEDLSVSFGNTSAVDHISIEINRGEILGMVGESGSGKSVTALTLMGLVSDSASITSGRILFDDKVMIEAGKARDAELYRQYQGERMSMIFQEPMTSLNPTQRVGVQVEELLRIHAKAAGVRRDEWKKRVIESFVSVGLKDAENIYDCYPHQLSGGMRQRVMIAMAVILHPDIIVADEPTTALDVTIQNQIISLLMEINKRERNAMLFITHDLNLARRICNRIAVMKDGRIVELGETEEIFRKPKMEYTKQLIKAAVCEDDKNSQSPDDRTPVVEVRDLNVYYQEGINGLFGSKRKRRVVFDADFFIYRGETLGLVGESGCGKSSLSKAILGMNHNIEGTIRHMSVRPQMIFQDPYSSLNPVKSVGWLLKEPLRAASMLDKSKRMSDMDMDDAVCDMLNRVGLNESYIHRKPQQLSGGQRQRISIAQALITRPELVIADEPVSALDVTLQFQIMELMKQLQEELGVAYLFISHDINVVYRMSDRIMVMKDGHIVEQGDTKDIFNSPKDEYTKLLLKQSNFFDS